MAALGTPATPEIPSACLVAYSFQQVFIQRPERISGVARSHAVLISAGGCCGTTGGEEGSYHVTIAPIRE